MAMVSLSTVYAYLRERGTLRSPSRNTPVTSVLARGMGSANQEKAVRTALQQLQRRGLVSIKGRTITVIKEVDPATLKDKAISVTPPPSVTALGLDASPTYPAATTARITSRLLPPQGTKSSF